jgi:hypothetical protein
MENKEQEVLIDLAQKVRKQQNEQMENYSQEELAEYMKQLSQNAKDYVTKKRG